MQSLAGRMLERNNPLVSRLGDLDRPKAIYERFFPSVGTFPISGGWGYTMEDACVIEPSLHTCETPFDFYTWENVIVEKRIFLECITTRAEGDEYNKLKWERDSQGLHSANGRSYDHLTYKVSGIPEVAWIEFQKEAEKASRAGSSIDALIKEVELKRHYFFTEYWFDIPPKNFPQT